ncbi:MAG TPA: integrin alpha [Planctomycetota bacterium]|jgi:glycosylphosphatidylinositol phospholipase D|nr:integrin alpha [Planctomycetota bacterium]
MKTASPARAASVAIALAALSPAVLSQLGPTVDLGSLGSGGVVFDGAMAGDESGWSLSGAGDVNGDGVDDFLISARHAVADAGRVYLIFGGGPFASPVNLASVGLTVPGVAITGEVPGDLAGWTLGAAGDVNGDGFDDILIGAPNADANRGRAYLVYGGPALPPAILLLTLGTAGVTFLGAAAGDEAGFSVAGAGDVNEDGFDDVLIGARAADPVGRPDAGRTHLVFGSTALPSTIPLPTSGTAGIFVFDGAASGDLSGFSVDGAGDVNGDGHPDVLIGARHADPGGLTNAGRACVVFGGPGLAPTTDLATLGSGGVCIDGCEAGDVLGFAVTGGADVNGDGFADPIVAARQANPNGLNDAGETYVLYGGSSLPQEVVGCNLGCLGVRIQGVSAGDQSGFSVAAIDDLNQDGYDDVLLGAPFAAPTGLTWQGESYLVHGSPALPAALPLASLGLGGTRFRGAAANDLSGYTVAAAGDVNGDGVLDLLIGAFLSSPAGAANAGRTFLVLGQVFSGGSVTSYGVGCPGTDGIVPQLGASGGAPVVGDSAFRIWLTDLLPGSVAFLFFATSPTLVPLPGGCELLVQFPGPTILVRLIAVSGACGAFDIGIPIPPDPAVANAFVYLQGGAIDPNGAFGLVSLSAGLEVHVRP